MAENALIPDAGSHCVRGYHPPGIPSTCRNRLVAQPLALVCGGLYVYIIIDLRCALESAGGIGALERAEH